MRTKPRLLDSASSGLCLGETPEYEMHLYRNLANADQPEDLERVGLYEVTIVTPIFVDVVHVIAESAEGAEGQATCGYGFEHYNIDRACRSHIHVTARPLPLIIRGWGRRKFVGSDYVAPTESNKLECR